MQQQYLPFVALCVWKLAIASTKESQDVQHPVRGRQCVHVCAVFRLFVYIGAQSTLELVLPPVYVRFEPDQLINCQPQLWPTRLGEATIAAMLDRRFPGKIHQLMSTGDRRRAVVQPALRNPRTFNIQYEAGSSASVYSLPQSFPQFFPTVLFVYYVIPLGLLGFI